MYLCLLMQFADNLCKHFGHRSGLIIGWARSGSKLFDTLMLFLKELKSLSLSHVVSWVRCGARLYQFLIFVAFLTLIMNFLGHEHYETVGLFVCLQTCTIEP